MDGLSKTTQNDGHDGPCYIQDRCRAPLWGIIEALPLCSPAQPILSLPQTQVSCYKRQEKTSFAARLYLKSCRIFRHHFAVSGSYPDKLYKHHPMSNVVFWDMSSYSSYKQRRFGGTFRLHLQGENNQRNNTVAVVSYCSTLRRMNHYMNIERFLYHIVITNTFLVR
jgi:hypothetical protein